MLPFEPKTREVGESRACLTKFAPRYLPDALAKARRICCFQIQMVICRMIEFSLTPVSISTRRKFTSILLAIVIFALLAGLASRAAGRPPMFAIANAVFVG